ncbi:MAG: NAD-dependent epimerase/dehydratase family protein [Rhodospirillales bacterium]|nr:NAD-dependent epimerase/dehydratase family protein [Rhodospirillales bacterium]
MSVYLVTGGAGFIGSHLVDSLLADGHGVRVLDDLSTGKRANLDPRAELVVGDVGDPTAVARTTAGVDGIVHLAAIASVQRGNEDWAGTHRTNLTAAIHVFDAARRAKTGGPVPVVYASSAAIYGDSPDLPLVETARPRPLSAYGADKLGCELHARVGGAVHGVPTAGFRFFNVFGPRQDPKSPYSGVISIFADRVRAGTACRIQGDGGQARDFVYVADVVAALRTGLAAASVEAPVFNVGTGVSTRIVDLAKILQRLAGSKADPEFVAARAGDIRLSLCEPSKLKALGWQPRTALEEGLRLTLASLG